MVDDGSTDRTGEEVRKFSRSHPALANLTLVEQGNRGQAAVLNECLRHATGDFIQFLDADDLIGPDNIERQVVRLPDSLSNRTSRRHWASQIRVLELCKSYVRGREDTERVRSGFARSWQHVAQRCHPL